VGGRSICLWYTSGGSYYGNVVADLIYPPDISSLDVRKYFAEFDGVAEDPNGSWGTSNKQIMALASWYLNGTLHLRGFFAGHHAPGPGEGYSYFTTSLEPKGPVQAWYWRDRTFYHFVEDTAGDSVLIALTGPPADAVAMLGPGGETLARFGLPPDQAELLSFHVIPRVTPAALGARIPANAHIRDVIPGRVERVDAASMVREADYRKDTARVFYTMSELGSAVTPPDRSGPSIPIKLENVDFKGSLTNAAEGNLQQYRIESAQSEALLYSFHVPLNPQVRYVLEFGLRIRRGRVAITVKDPVSGRDIVQIFRKHSQPMTEERLEIDGDSSARIMVMVAADNFPPAAADFEIANVRLWQAGR
jgi:hypothetical protein